MQRKSFKTAAVFAKRTEPMGEALKKLLDILRNEGISYLLEESTAEHLPDAKGVSLEELGTKADVIIMLGGDGTTLGIARRMARFKLPIIAINAGRLGFITDFSLHEMDKDLPPLLRGEYEIDTRTMLHVRVYREGNVVFTATAVNDAGITHGRAGSMVEFNVWVDGHPMATQRADGSEEHGFGKGVDQDVVHRRGNAHGGQGAEKLPDGQAEEDGLLVLPHLFGYLDLQSRSPFC